MSSLYQKHLYLAKHDYIINSNIVEYDMKEGGFSLIKEFGLLDESTILKLEKFDKKQRTIMIGKIQKENKQLAKELANCFVKARKLFLEENEIPDDKILAIKKDAIILVNQYVKQNEFGNINFRPKHMYTSYYKLGRLECYYDGMNNRLDVKGIHDDLLQEHQDYIMKFLKKVFKKVEIDIDSAIKVIYKFSNEYRKLELKKGYYREFNSYSGFKLKEYDMALRKIDRQLLDNGEIDISYNYMNIIVKLVQLLY